MIGPARVEDVLRTDCEVLVIGSGAGGACVADVLTAAGRDVLLVEEGPYYDPQDAPAEHAEAMSRFWRSGGMTAALGATPVAYVEGAGLGGGTTINSAIFQFPPDELLEEWREAYRIEDFGADALRPYLERSAAIVKASLTPKPLGAHSELLRRGAENKGWKVTELLRGQDACTGANLCMNGCPTGGKQSMANALLPQAVRRGLRLITECRIARLTTRGGRITGAVGSARGHDGRVHRVSIRARHVFASAGAIQTPALLQRSGMRTRAGHGLRLHPTVKAVALFDEVVDAHRSRLPLYAVTEFLPDQRIGGSAFTPGLFATGLAEDWAHRGPLMEDYRRCGTYYGMVRARGTGRVRALPGLREPVVRYALEESDWRHLAQVLGRLGEVLFAAGARRVIPSIAGHPGWEDPARCLSDTAQGLPRDRTSLMTIHLFSSCPPGEASQCVTDSFGRVRGYENLYVADASLIPEGPGVNPQAMVMAMALRSAEAFLAHPDAETGRAAARERREP